MTFKFRKHNAFGCSVILRPTLKAKKPTGADVPPFGVSSFIRVLSGSLNPHKQWYVLTIEMCGIRPDDFAKMELFTKMFPNEIRTAEAWELNLAISYSTRNARQPFVISAGLLRQKVIHPHWLRSHLGFFNYSK